MKWCTTSQVFSSMKSWSTTRHLTTSTNWSTRWLKSSTLTFSIQKPKVSLKLSHKFKQSSFVLKHSMDFNFKNRTKYSVRKDILTITRQSWPRRFRKLKVILWPKCRISLRRKSGFTKQCPSLNRITWSWTKVGWQWRKGNLSQGPLWKQ